MTLVRQYSPEKDPRPFAQIREAYEQLRDAVTRVFKQLSATRTTESLDDIVTDVQKHIRSVRIPTNTEDD